MLFKAKQKGLYSRWLNYDPVGRDLEGTPFVPFKTPLDKSFFDGKDDLSEDECFDVERIVKYVGFCVSLYLLQFQSPFRLVTKVKP